ncbi:MAG: cell division protein ZapA [Prevotellaceae bacterium]|nr:cell division protein ZapA [Prevotellaceae bacterium]
MDGQKIAVNLRIGKIMLPMTVSNTEQEKIVRDAATLVQNKLNAIHDRFPSLPSEEYYYAMAALNAAIDAVSASDKASAAPLMEVVNELSDEIEELIKK